MKVIIPNPHKLEKTKSNIKNAGSKSLHILSDFDRTLTYGVVNGVKTPSIISLLRDGKHLTKHYHEKAHELFNKYHAFEINNTLPLEVKKEKMREWWEAHNKLLIQEGLTKSDLDEVVKNGFIKFREGVPKFLDLLFQHQIPLVILSASGLGDAIPLFFKKINKSHPNIHYVINQFNWDENGRALSPKGQIFHSANKDESALKEKPEIYLSIKGKKNVILMGDSIDDLKMVHGFDYENLITIGFLNTDYNHSNEEYEKKFDIVLEGDGDLGFVNNFIKDLL